MQLKTTETENGTRIEIISEEKAAVVIQEEGEERILLPLKNEYAESTYYHENTSGLTKTENGYVGFYNGCPEQIKLIN